jgi:heme/copper-type cytochrome/quinol oxidase subunit 3
MSAVSAVSAVSATGPGAARSRSGHTAVVGAMLMATAGLVSMMALGVFYIALRTGAAGDYASSTGMKFNNYSAVTIVFTMLMASGAAGWGVAAARLGNRRWGATGFGLAILFDLAALNLLWDIGQKLNVGVAEFSATTIIYTLLVAGGIAMGIGAVSSIGGLVSVIGGHSSPATRYQALACSIGQHFAGLAWLVPFIAVFLKK